MKFYLGFLLCLLSFFQVYGQVKPISFLDIELKLPDTSEECEYFLNADVHLKVFLEGAYDASMGEMKTHLNNLGLLPLEQPYNTAPYHYYGQEAVSEFPEEAVDWVLVEARRETPQHEDMVKIQAGILLKNGNIVSPDGTPLMFRLEKLAQYHFCIRHRNHLDIVSSEMLVVENDMFFDFSSDIGQVMGFNQLTELSDGTMAMFTGDITQEGIIQLTDFDAWKVNPAQVNVYSAADITLDGVVQVTDFDAWLPNKAKVGFEEIRF